jgi:acetyl-CoA acetyltransferase
MRDQVAVVGVGTTAYGRNLNRTPLSLGLEAAMKAIEDAGLDKQDIDGICGGGLRPAFNRDANYLALQEALGIHETNWVLQSWLGACFVLAAEAVVSGTCDVALVVQAYQRDGGMSSSARNDAIRARATTFGAHRGFGEYIWHAESYAAWAGRYMYDYGAPREVFGMLAVNNRTNAVANENAALRTPITMDDYLGARMIREPLGMLDFDYPVDCGEAVILTTPERAKDLRRKPVYVNAATFGQPERGAERYENGNWTEVAPWIAMRKLWSKSDYKVSDMDLFYPYDGFSPIAINFTEAAGFCGPGEAWPCFQQSWDDKEKRLKLNGKTLMHTGGGSMSHGRVGGFNYYTEAVRQLRGEADGRQVAGAKTALFGIGSFYHDSVAVVLHTA